ncbi:MAG: hypothetical protein N3G19_00045 [Candidatus Pacearchaeota archaeon]|nr:hypothetical protein [Candidatus Pacearchaeota archaeon]
MASYDFANFGRLEEKVSEAEEILECFWKKISKKHESQKELCPGFSKCYECEGKNKDCKFYRI